MRRNAPQFGFWVSLTIALAIAPAIVAIAPAAQAQGIQYEQPPAVRPATTTISISPDSVSTDPMSRGADDVSSLLDRGRELETQRRWQEALTHYEGAIRNFPDDRGLQQRFDFSRLHYDIRRRYNDSSFRDSLTTMPVDKALDLYDQILLKIQAHYVDTADWKSLIGQGTSNLEVALSESPFLERNVPAGRQAEISAFCRDLRRALQTRTIATRGDAHDAVAWAAGQARQRLAMAPTAVVLEYVCGATNSLDPYSAYLTPNQLSEVYSQIEGNFVGLGIELKAIDGKLTIVRVITGSPAQQGGLRDGDRILKVDGRSTADMSTDRAADLLQGKVNSVARLTVATSTQPPRNVSIQRRRVDVPSVDGAKIVEPRRGIAYFRLVCFQKTTCDDIDRTLWDLHRQGMKSLIIDLRGNPGGLLVTAVNVVDKFVDRGIIVSTRGRSVQEDFTYSAHVAGTWRVPLVVMIDQDSASAAEIFAGAIREHRRGTIVGVRSYGKGSVQGIFPLDQTTAGVRLTTAKFYSPTGRPYSRVGVTPDVTVHKTARPIDGRVVASGKDDTMLAAAVQAAHGLGNPR